MMTRNTAVAALCMGMLVAAGVQAGGDPAKGAELAVECAACHGENGLGDDMFPAIAGTDEAAMVSSLAGFKSGETEGDFMPDIVTELSEQDMADLAAYFATLAGPDN